MAFERSYPAARLPVQYSHAGMSDLRHGKCSLPQSLRGLLEPAAYPHAVDSIELVQTHISWLLLTGDYAYKIKRPVRYAFIDLTDPGRRAFDCREELRLNRRFAPSLYLEVCEIRADATGAHIGGPGQVIEHAVRMRQFDRDCELDRLLEAGRIEPDELGGFGRALARLHLQLPVARDPAPWATAARVRTLVLQNHEQAVDACVAPALKATLQALRAPLESRLAELESCIDRRRSAGRVRECHGDLHTRNVVRLGGELVAFDCLEFDEALRWIDVADEISFLSADLQARNAGAHAHAFLAGYLAESGDYEACRLLPLYEAHRSLVRAKVTALAGDERVADHVRTAQTSLERPRPQLILVSGLSGSGKTWLAKRLAPRLEAIHLRSDVERKRLAGVADMAHSDSAVGAGLYVPQASAEVYAHLEICAGHALAGGRSVIVDATFGRREDRARFAALAKSYRVRASLIFCSAPVEVLRHRIVERAARGSDASEANLAVLDWQRARFSEAVPEEGWARIDVHSTGSGPGPDLEALTKALQ